MCEGMRQSAIARRVGIARATVNRTLQRHAAIGSLRPGKSPGAPHKTTPPQDLGLLRMAQEDRFISARTLTDRMQNLYGVRAGLRTINTRLVVHGYHARRLMRKTPLTAYHRRMRLAWTQRWRNLTVAHHLSSQIPTLSCRWPDEGASFARGILP